MKRVYLIRHAEAEFSGHGRGDHGRRLTQAGLEQAERLGRLLTDAGIELVLSSSASRAAQTAAGLGLQAPTTLSDDLYNAGTPDLLASLAELPARVSRVALVAHSPGVPALVHELAGPDSDPAALDSVRHHYPTATASGIEFSGSWQDLAGSRLIWVGQG